MNEGLKNKLKAIFSHVATVASFVLVFNDKVKELPFTPPSWLVVGLSGAAAVAGVVLHFLPKPGTPLEPTPDLTVEDTGAALGKASGKAGAAAGRGPFVK